MSRACGVAERRQNEAAAGEIRREDVDPGPTVGR
jgi:hypothetical protein